MIDVCIYTMIGLCVLCAVLGMIYFYLEHNSEHDESLKSNPVKLKWVIGAILGGMTVAGVMCYKLANADLTIEDMLCTYGLIAGIASILVAKIYCEGISAVAKWAKQKVVEVKEADVTLSDVLAFMQEQKAEMDDVKKKLGMS